MFLTKKHLSRRTVLRGGAGIAISLPLLEAMIPAGTALAQTAGVAVQPPIAKKVPHVTTVHGCGDSVDPFGCTEERPGTGASEPLARLRAARYVCPESGVTVE